MKGKIKLLFIILSVSILLLGFKQLKATPNVVYRVYLDGKSLGIINSKNDLEKYIDKRQEQLKEKYGVEKVYVPEELDIVKEITYSNDISSVEKIYNEIQDKAPFTISGYEILIKGIKTKDGEGKDITTKDKYFYVLDKKVFTNSVEKTVKSFISPEEYEKYKNDTQTPIKETGKIIENIYIENRITIKKKNISVNKKIFLTDEELSKQLLFGTTKEQNKYVVKAGDTISEVAYVNKMSEQEFLIANPKFQDANSLLFAGQEVTIGTLQPQFSMVEVDHVVEDQEQKYKTEIKYDNDKNVGYEEKIQEGINGKTRVTQKIKKVNGSVVNVVMSPEVLKPAVNEVIVKGGKQRNYPMWNGGGSAPATAGLWGWPTITPYYISSSFGWRWGTLHPAIDIAGCGEGSPIYAAREGTVVTSGSRSLEGQYIVINHNDGYYSMYAHLCNGCRYVSAGQTVTRGQVIGGMGHTGWATGTHLHFAIWIGMPEMRGSTPLNPFNFY